MAAGSVRSGGQGPAVGAGLAERREREADLAVDLRADRHAAVRALDLDELRRLVQARAPVDDAVAAGVHRHVADLGRELARDRVPEAVAAVPAQAAPGEQAGEL